jgi:hypothetical protein
MSMVWPCPLTVGAYVLLGRAVRVLGRFAGRAGELAASFSALTVEMGMPNSPIATDQQFSPANPEMPHIHVPYDPQRELAAFRVMIIIYSSAVFRGIDKRYPYT